MKAHRELEKDECQEESFIKSYMDLTGVTESQARAVFMYVGCKENVCEEDWREPVDDLLPEVC